MASDERHTDIQRKGLDMTLALTGPDSVQKDKRFHTRTDDVLKLLVRNSRKEQHH